MLTDLHLTNFRSCLDTKISFSPVTLLIGRNNAGKSNVCQAIRFLQACSTSPDFDLAARVAGMRPSEAKSRASSEAAVEISAEVELARAAGESQSVHYRLALDARPPDAQPGHILTAAAETLTAEGPETWDLSRTSDVASSSPMKASVHLPPDMPLLGVTSLVISANDLTIAPVLREVRSWRYHNLQTPVLRKSEQADYDAYLRGDGSNLASVLFSLKNEDDRSFELFLNLVREVEPAIHMLNFIRPRPEEVFMQIEDTAGNRYSPDSLSDGTLNYMAMCYIALQGQLTTHHDAVPPGLVVIEEPENGLYVGQLRRLFELLQESSQSQQIILTTHNPYLIDLFEDHPEQVRIVKRGGLGASEGTVVETPEPGRIERLLEQFSLGEMYFRGLLE